MKVVLVVPPSSERIKRTPDLGLGYLAACLRQAGHEVLLLDCFLEDLDCQAAAERVRESGARLVGMKVYSLDVPNAQQMLRAIHQAAPQVSTVIGGPHPTCEEPERLFEQFPDLDYAVAGEGERSIVALASLASDGSVGPAEVPGLIWREDGAVRRNPKTTIENLDTLPLPAWDLIDPRRYPFGYSYLSTELPAAPMALTRGCPFLCTYCASHLITGRKVRTRSLDSVMEEIHLLVDRYGVKTIDVVDENVTYDRDWVLAFCERLTAEKTGVKWNCPNGVRLNSLDEEVVQAMERSGCTGISVGIESGSDRILKMVKKSLTVAQVTEKVHTIKKASKMVVQGFFMLGFSEETREEMEQTIELARTLPLDLAVFSMLWPVPGTEMYNHLVTKGCGNVPQNAIGVGHDYFVQSYCALSNKELHAIYRKAYIRFYSRPRALLTLARILGTWSQFKIARNALTRLWRKPRVRPSAVRRDS